MDLPGLVLLIVGLLAIGQIAMAVYLGQFWRLVNFFRFRRSSRYPGAGSYFRKLQKTYSPQTAYVVL